MSCCSCPQPCLTRHVFWLPHVGFGLVLVGIGVNHYRHLGDFVAMSGGVFASVPAIGTVAGLLSYLFPALLIIGGALFASRQCRCLSKVFIVAALSGIMGWGGLALMLGDATAGSAVMPAIQTAFVFLITYWVIKKMSCCGKSCAPGMGSGAACVCGKGGACTCGKTSM